MIKQRDVRSAFGWALAFNIVGASAYLSLRYQLHIVAVFIILAIASFVGGGAIAYFEQEPKQCKRSG